MNTTTIPTTPAECVAAVSLNDDNEAHPYLSIFYTVHEGTIYFFGLEVTGTETVPAEQEGEDPSERLLYQRPDGPQTTNPDEAEVLISGALDELGMTLAVGPGEVDIVLGTQEQAVNFIQVIRYVYTMQAQLLQEQS